MMCRKFFCVLGWNVLCYGTILFVALMFADGWLTAEAAPPPANTEPGPPATQPESDATTRPSVAGNPPAKGFNAERSDEKAIAIADAVMEKMGGRQAWDATRYIEWSFFGKRSYVWDKHTGDVRIRFPHPSEDLLVLMNLNTQKGRVWKNREEITNEYARDGLLKEAYDAWINDSYWLIMPYKLKDSGVSLKHLGEFKTERGKQADVIRLSFERVGVTPDNVYHVYVGKESGLVEQWDWFRNFYDEEPTFKMPWLNWQKHGGIMLSADRGGGRVIPDVAVRTDIPREVFTEPEPFDRRGAEHGG